MESITKWLDSHRDEALLVVRILLGAMFIFVHGGAKLMGGEAAWTKVGSMIGILGITFAPTFLGLIASLCELVGGIFIFLGLFTRLGAALIFSTLIIAAPTMYLVTKSLFGAAAPIEDALFMIVLIFVGGGKYSLDQWLFAKKR